MMESVRRLFVSAILAGISIGLGGTIFLSVNNKLFGAFMFSMGLFVVCTHGLHLFTGKICYAFNLMKISAKDRDPQGLIYFSTILFGNFVGATLFSIAVKFTRISIISEKAKVLCEVKATDSLLSLFFLAVICNVFIFIGVNGYNRGTNQVSQNASIFLGVMGFILCGAEHCIADMFYISLAGMWSLNMLMRIIVIIIGNSIGGLLAAGALEYVGGMDKPNTQKQL